MSRPKRAGLGRGLSALIDEAPQGTRELPVADLEPNRLQPRTRFAEAEIEELAASIRAQGVIQPLVVTPDGSGGHRIVAGERRWRAAQRAGLERVPVFVREVSDERELLELALVENLQREDLDPIEEAEAYRSLQERFGLSQEEVARRVGKSRPAVGNALRLLKLPEAVRELLASGELAAGQARPLLALPDAEAQTELARRAVREGLTARDLERLARRPPPAEEPRPKPAKPKLDVHSRAAEEKLTRRLQTKVEIRRRKKGGSVILHFHGEEELMRLYDLLMERGEEES